jgi:hypothetical protein
MAARNTTASSELYTWGMFQATTAQATMLFRAECVRTVVATCLSAGAALAVLTLHTFRKNTNIISASAFVRTTCYLMSGRTITQTQVRVVIRSRLLRLDICAETRHVHLFASFSNSLCLRVMLLANSEQWEGTNQ